MKLLKKTAVLLVAISMCMGTAAYAAQKPQPSIKSNKLPEEVQEALDKTIDSIPELGTLQLESIDFDEEDEYGPERWEFSFTDGKSLVAPAEVVLDAETGLIFSYEMNYSDRDTKKPKAPTEKAAKKAAEQFLKNIWGTQAKQYKFSEFDYYRTDVMDEDEDPTEAEVTYDLYINNVQVENFEVILRVDGKGRIVSLDNNAIVSLDKSKFPNPQQAIKHSKAMELYKKLLDMSLSYEWVGEDIVLVYEPRFLEGAIDAFTGKISNEVDNSIRQRPERIDLEPQGVQLVARSREEAESMLSREFGISFEGLEYELDEYDDDDEEEEERPSITYEWSTPRGADEYISVSLSANRKTGKVITYEYVEGRSNRRDPNVTLNEAKQIALDILRKYLPAKIKSLSSYSSSPYETEELPDWVEPDERYDDPNPYNRNYSFRFHDLYQNAEVGFSRYYVEIDPETGKVASLAFHGEDDFSGLPDTRDAISPQKAAEAYAKASPLEMVYVWPTYDEQKRPSPILLYIPREHDVSYIDAFSGKIIKDE